MDLLWFYVLGLLLFLGLFLVGYAFFLPRQDKRANELLESYRFRSQIHGDE